MWTDLCTSSDGKNSFSEDGWGLGRIRVRAQLSDGQSMSQDRKAERQNGRCPRSICIRYCVGAAHTQAHPTTAIGPRSANIALFTDAARLYIIVGTTVNYAAEAARRRRRRGLETLLGSVYQQASAITQGRTNARTEEGLPDGRRKTRDWKMTDL